MTDNEPNFNAEIAALRDERPTLTAIELDAVRARIERRAARRTTRAWRGFARTRGAVIATITAGALISTGGTAIAVSGLGGSGSASTAQYAGSANPGTSEPGASNPSPNAGNGVGGFNGTGNGPGSGKNPQQAVSPSEQATQPTKSSSGKLPFTGFLAIPILLIGLALVIVGLLARRLPSARDDRGAPS